MEGILFKWHEQEFVADGVYNYKPATRFDPAEESVTEIELKLFSEKGDEIPIHGQLVDYWLGSQSKHPVCAKGENCTVRVDNTDPYEVIVAAFRREAGR